MSINISKLKEGDVVVFGGTVEKTVNWNGDSLLFKGDCYVTHPEDRIWQIAQLKRAPLPEHLILAPGTTNGWLIKQIAPSYYTSGDKKWDFTAEDILSELKKAVAQLEEAGVEA